MARVSVKQARDVDAPNAYLVTITDEMGLVTNQTVHTNAHGEGLWANGKQILGTAQFSVGRDPARAIRRHFERKES
jgi:hypothetical protein